MGSALTISLCLSFLTGGVVRAAAVATTTPAFLFFAEQADGSTSTSQTVTLQNTGTTSMKLTSQTLAGTDAADFAITADDCGATLASGASCAVQVDFSPSGYGGYAATLDFADGPGTQKIPVAGTVSDSYSSTVLAQSPTAYWRLDPPASPVPMIVGDASGNDDYATIQDASTTAPTFGDPGPESCTSAETSVELAASATAYFSAASSQTNPQDFTLEAWFRTTSTAGGALISFANTATGTPTNFDRALYVGTDGLLYWGVSDGTTVTELSSSQTVDDGTWHMAVASISGSGMALYLDGALVATNALSPDDNYTGYWWLGAMATSGFTNAGSGFFAGALGEVAVIPGAVSAVTVAQQWDAASSCELGLTAPSALSWTASLTGLNQSVDDAASIVVADYPYYGPGWNITVAATSLSSGSHSLSAVPSGYAVNGSATSASATAKLGKSCTGSGHVAPTGSSVTYPLELTAAPELLYTAAVDTGEGTCTLDTDWWLAVPADTYAGTYTGTVTLTLASGP